MGHRAIMRKWPSKKGWEIFAEAARFDANELAQLSRISVRQLQRIFQRRFGRSPQEWLNERRLVAAQDRLLAGDSVKKVALELGFRHSSHFCRQFKAIKRMTPSEFISLRMDPLMGCRPRLTDVVQR